MLDTQQVDALTTFPHYSGVYAPGRRVVCQVVERYTGMESKTQVAGHPAHPILIVFPLGLLANSVIFDSL